MRTADAQCELCTSTAGDTVWEDNLCRVVRVADPDYPGYCRVILREHVREMTDLSAPERRHLMSVVFAVEAALRRLTRAEKVNLASLGNRMPHLHWHVIARFVGDRHWPDSIWSASARASGATAPGCSIELLRREIIQALAEEHGGML